MMLYDRFRNSSRDKWSQQNSLQFQFQYLFLFCYKLISQEQIGNQNYKPLSLLEVDQELALQSEANWDVVRLQDLNRFKKAIVIPTKPTDIIKLVTGLMGAFKPTTKQLIEGALLDDFTTTWQGHLLSLKRSQTPEIFVRMLVDQIEVRKDKFQKINNSNGNLLMLVKFYISLAAMTHITTDTHLKKNLKWLSERIISMRNGLIRCQYLPGGYGVQWGGILLQDQFTKQKASQRKYDQRKQFIGQMDNFRDKIKKNWKIYLEKLIA